MRHAFWLVIPIFAGTLSAAQAPTKAAVREAVSEVGAVIDDWHLAAAQSDEARYLTHLTPQAVFIGFDEKERWPGDDFRKWIHSVFVNHAIWTFKASQRNISLSENGDVAWFDELIDMSGSATGRGTGVLVRDGKTWLITQYSLSLPIPRQVLGEVISVIYNQKMATALAAEPDKKSKPVKPVK
jgi:ketosteroid isomerase-like protein